MPDGGTVFIDPKQVDALVPDEDLHVSYSQLKTYLLCPQRYWQQYVLMRTPSHRVPEMVLGGCLHETLALHHGCIQVRGEAPDQEKLHDDLARRLKVAENRPVPVLWNDDEGPTKLAEQAHVLLDLYYREVKLHKVLAVEKAFSIPPSEWSRGRGRGERLVGVVDVIEEDADGTVWLTELKTAARRFDDKRLAFDPQLSIYAAARKALGVPDAKLRYRVLLKQKKPAIVTYQVHRSESDIREALDLTEAVLRAVDHCVTYRQRGWQCDACPYRATCGE